jgi:ABC-type phosphate transport system auxiliary subunit
LSAAIPYDRKSGGLHFPDVTASVIAQLQRLITEERRLLNQGELGAEERHRLAALQSELDQSWELLRHTARVRPVDAHIE